MGAWPRPRISFQQLIEPHCFALRRTQSYKYMRALQMDDGKMASPTQGDVGKPECELDRDGGLESSVSLVSPCSDPPKVSVRSTTRIPTTVTGQVTSYLCASISNRNIQKTQPPAMSVQVSKKNPRNRIHKHVEAHCRLTGARVLRLSTNTHPRKRDGQMGGARTA